MAYEVNDWVQFVTMNQEVTGKVMQTKVHWFFGPMYRLSFGERFCRANGDVAERKMVDWVKEAEILHKLDDETVALIESLE